MDYQIYFQIFTFNDKNNNKRIQKHFVTNFINNLIKERHINQERHKINSIRYFKTKKMFSYLPSRHYENNIQNNLIQEIQFIAHQIFDNHTTSLSKTDQQEMSLQLSPATSQDNFQINKNKQIHDNQQQDYFSQLNSYKKNFNFDNQNQKKDKIKILQRQDHGKRMSKSMVFRNNFKQPGSFSNKYTGVSHKQPVNASYKHTGKNLSSSTIINTKNRPNDFKEQSENETPLKKSNLNKSNILMGILNQKKQQNHKKSPKKNKYSSNFYASNYLSPYSTKRMKQNPKSYMQKSPSISPFKKTKQTIELQYIKRRINQNLQPQISYRKQKSQKNQLTNPKLSNIKSKYKQCKPILHQYKLYADEHIYKKMKTQMNVWEEKKKLSQLKTNQQIQQTWQQFIQKQSRFLQQKKQKIISKQFQKMNQQTQQSIPPTKNIAFNSNKDKFNITNTPKLTPEDFVKKYKREKQKIKQKLQSNQISNFLQRSYEDSKKMGRYIFDSVWGSTLQKDLIRIPQVQVFSTIKESQFSTIKQNSKFFQNTLNSKIQNSNDNAPSVVLQNFFISVQKEEEYKNFKKNKLKSQRSNQKQSLSKSSIYQPTRNNQRRSNQRQHNNSNHFSQSRYINKDLTSLSPFMKKAAVKQQLRSKYFDPKKHNSPLFNQSLIGSSKLKQKAHKKQSSAKKVVSELLNPKYFRSINELQEYSSNSRQKVQKNRKTFQIEIYQNYHKQKDNFMAQYLVNKQKYKTNINQNGLYDQHQINKTYNLRNSDQKRNVIAKFDQNLMKKTIQDLQRMKNQIQENKRKRKHAIQNYRNFSNVRNDSSFYQSSSRQQNMKSYQNRRDTQNYDQAPKIRQKLIQRNNSKNQYSRKTQERSKSPIYIQGNSKLNIVLSPRGRSRSVSPIHQQDSISNHSDLSVSPIQPVNEASYNNENTNDKNSQISQYSSRLMNSNLIMVKNKTQIEFIMGDSVVKNNK